MDSNSFKEVSISDFKTQNSNNKEQIQDNTANNIFDEAFAGLDDVVEKTKQESLEYQRSLREEEIETGQKIERVSVTPEKESKTHIFDLPSVKSQERRKNLVTKPIETADERESLKTTSVSESKPIASLFDKPTNLDNAIEDLDDDEKKETEKNIKELSASIKEKIKPITNIIDISSFTISKKPISIVNALSREQTTRVADWVLPATGRSISISEFKGLDIEKINPRNTSRNRLNMYKDIYGVIYDHVIDKNKPDFESWIKLINFYDIDHLYFAIFRSAFDTTNALPYNCPHCKKAFLQDMSIDQMVKYVNEEIKKKVQLLLNKDTTTDIPAYNIELVQVSDTYVIGLREPSIYNIIFENAALDEDFSTQYRELLSTLSFIDSIYVIDRESQSLLPIECKIYPTDIVKTIKTKIRKYAEILKIINSDQFFNLNSMIQQIAEKHDNIHYVLPEVKCPHCGRTVPEEETTAEQILFTRHSLRALTLNK